MSFFQQPSTFGQQAPASNFGQTSFFNPQQTQPTFSGTSTAPLFGQQPVQSQLSLFGPTSTFSFSGGQQAPGSTGGMFGPQSTTFPQQQQQQQASFQNIAPSSHLNLEAVQNFTAALRCPQIYGDERDAIIAHLNQLQAFCGFGKGFYSSTASPIEFTPENVFCRLKTICYNRLSGVKDEDGLVAMVVKKSEQEVKNNLQLFLDNLFKILGNKPQLNVGVEAVKPLPDNKCEVVLFITETGPSGVKKRISANETYNFFNQPSIKQQLLTILMVEQLVLKVDLSADKMREYLAVPQAGTDLLLWQQAVVDNPDPQRLVPHPVLGFSGLRDRQKLQKIENEMHDACLKELSKRVEQVEDKLITSQSKLIQMKSLENQLSHRLLKVVSMLVIEARQGYALEVNEEMLNSKLESINALLNGSAQLKGRMAEIMSHFRSRDEAFLRQPKTKQNLDDDVVLELKQYLRKYQDAVEKVVNLVKKDSKDLSVMKDVLLSGEITPR